MRAALLVVLAAATAHAEDSTRFANGLGFDPATVYKVPRGHSPSEGPADAPVTIVDWSDYACTYCNRVQDTLDRLDRLYPGQIRWVHRTLPLDDDDTIAAEAALAAAAQGKFRPMHERLYALHGAVDRVDVELIARELGLDMIRFRAALDTGAYRPAIAADVTDAKALGVTGTPMLFVDGRPVRGNQPLRVFAEVVDQELARAREVAPGKPPDLYEALVAAGMLAANSATETPEPPPLDSAEVYRVGFGLPNHALGPETALVTIVEWSDFQCPFCARQAPVLARLRDKYGDQVRLIYRHFPVWFHRESMIAAEAGVAAAAQDRFWAFHDQVFAHPGQLTRADLEADAKAAGLDLAAFRAALDDHRYHDAVIAEGAAAQALGVEGTPTLFVNGRPVVGARDDAALDRIVQVHLDRARAAVAAGLAPRDLYAVIMSMAKDDDRADPSSVPMVTHVEPRNDDRARSVIAACRLRDAPRAIQLAARLTGDARARAAAVCSSQGIDLP